MPSQLVAWDRLVRYESQNEPGQVKYGEPILEDSNADVAELARSGKLEVRVLEGGDALSATRSSATEMVGKLCGPLAASEVPIVRCVGLNYKTHSELLREWRCTQLTCDISVLETGRPLPTCPTIFTKPGPSIADHGEDIPIPNLAQAQCDYEGELVIVIGKDAKNVPAANALEYVAGYTVGNDVSARDWQREAGKAGPVPQWTFSKSFDKYAPLGPVLVAGHVLGEADGMSLKTFVNGSIRQESNTSDLCFGVKELVAFCSQGQTLQKGSVIMTGTPGGVGLFMKPPAFLQHGDTVVVEIEKIGRLANRMSFE